MAAPAQAAVKTRDRSSISPSNVDTITGRLSAINRAT
jgi:hypothetical protein